MQMMNKVTFRGLMLLDIGMYFITSVHTGVPLLVARTSKGVVGGETSRCRAG